VGVLLVLLQVVEKQQLLVLVQQQHQGLKQLELVFKVL
jgi:hypothetical protein